MTKSLIIQLMIKLIIEIWEETKHKMTHSLNLLGRATLEQFLKYIISFKKIYPSPDPPLFH